MRLFIICLVVLFSLIWGCVEARTSPRIAIIGAGIGGSSSVHFLRQLFGDDANIDVYEKGDIGGRLETVEIGGREYEAGASIIHPRNEYMVNFTKMFGLHARDSAQVRLGVFDGQQLVVDGSEWKAVLIGQLLWRYGWDIFTVNNYVNKLVQDFSNIYSHQDRAMAFTTPEKLIASISPSFSELLTHSVAEELRRNGLSDVYIEEVVRGALRTNYGQEENIHALVGSISLAGIQPGLWAVHGGNKKIVEQLLQRSKANVIRSEVTKVTLKPLKGHPNFEVETNSGSKTEYSIVIVATPLHEGASDIKFENFAEPVRNFKGRFHCTVSNFVKGQINVTKFGVPTEDRFPRALLASGSGMSFNSIGLQHPVDYTLTEAEDFDKQTKVWKVFSENPLTRDELNDLFVTIEEAKQVDFLAYPHYDSTATDFPPFQLSPQLYYVNGIEWMGSTLETSAIGARNVALLAHHTWYDRPGSIDRPPMHVVTDKTEL